MIPSNLMKLNAMQIANLLLIQEVDGVSDALCRYYEMTGKCLSIPATDWVIMQGGKIRDIVTEWVEKQVAEQRAG